MQREDALRSPPRRAEARSGALLRIRILVRGTCESEDPRIGSFKPIRGSLSFTQPVQRSQLHVPGRTSSRSRVPILLRFSQDAAEFLRF